MAAKIDPRNIEILADGCVVLKDEELLVLEREFNHDVAAGATAPPNGSCSNPSCDAGSSNDVCQNSSCGDLAQNGACVNNKCQGPNHVQE